MTTLATPIVAAAVIVAGYFGITDPDVINSIKVLIAAVIAGVGALHVILNAFNHRKHIKETAEVAKHQINMNAGAVIAGETAQLITAPPGTFAGPASHGPRLRAEPLIGRHEADAAAPTDGSFPTD